MSKLTIKGQIVVAGRMDEIEVDGIAIEVPDKGQLRAAVHGFYARPCKITFEWDEPPAQLSLPGLGQGQSAPKEAPHA